jgi:hypothetical protein
VTVPRHLRPLLAVAVLGVAVALAETVAGVGTGLLLLSPALALFLPLVAGRYPGAAQLERLAARRRTARRVRAISVALPRRRPRTMAARGGRLLASALAERGPPLTV